MAQIDFDTASIETTNSGPIPAGWYAARVAASEMRLTQAGDNRLVVTFRIAEGYWRGRSVTQGFMLSHAKPDVVRIGREQFATLAKAAGVPRCTDSDQLHGRAVELKLIETTDWRGEPGNEVKGVRALDRVLPDAPATPTTTTFAEATGTAPARPIADDEVPF